MKLPSWVDAAAVAGGMALLLLAMFGMWMAGIHHQQLADAQHQERPIIDTIRVHDSLFVHDTVRLTVVRHRTDSLLRVDTLLQVDTVRQIVERERAACDTVVSACEARVAARDSLNANLRRQIKLLQRGHGFLGSLPGKLLWGGAGFLIGRAIP